MTTNNLNKKKRKYISDIIFAVIILAILFIPGGRSLVQKGLLSIGLFKPKVEIPSKIDLNTESAANYEMSFISDDGQVLDLEQLKGKTVFINFWATWCPPCIAEMPTIEKLYQHFENDKNVVFVILEVDGNRTKAPEFMRKRNLDLPVYYPTNNIPKAFYDGTLPTTVILDRKGNIAHRSTGLTNFSGKKMINYLKDLSSL